MAGDVTQVAGGRVLAQAHSSILPWRIPRTDEPARLLCPWDFPGKNTGVGHHFLLQGIFPTQALNPGPRSKHLLISWLQSPSAVILLLLLLLLSHFSCVRLCVTLWTVACKAPLSMGFSRQEYWNGLPCPSTGDLPNPGIKPASLALAGRFFTTITSFKGVSVF